VTGAIAFQVLGGTTQTSVLYIPSSDRLIEVAGLGDAAGSSTAATPAAADTGVTAATPVAAASEACAGFDAWVQVSLERFNVAGELANGLRPIEEKTAADAPAIRQAAEDFAALSAEQEASQPPPAAESFNAIAVGYLTGTSQALDFLAEGLENGDAAQQVVALANLSEVEQALFTGEATAEFDALLAECSPE
jgi:hypothetical protein